MNGIKAQERRVIFTFAFAFNENLRDSQATCLGVGTERHIMERDVTVTPSDPRKYMAFCDQLHAATNLLTYSIDQSPSSQANRFSVSQEISPHFMEPEGSLPHSQVPATCPYAEPARSSPYPHIPLPEDPS